MRKAIISIILISVLCSVVYAELNPSKVYCESMGYRSIFEDGVRYCQFPDGSMTNSWDFLKGLDGQEYNYCTIKGYGIKTMKDWDICGSIYSEQCSVCVLKNGKEVEVTTLMELDFNEGSCGDGFCASFEDHLGCPADCRSGLGNGVCDGQKDGRCDPDCAPDEDLDCNGDPLRDEEAVCISDDGVCDSECIDTDTDCKGVNASGEGYGGEQEPHAELYPEQEVECVYDGICHHSCVGQDDLDCLCYDPGREECKRALSDYEIESTPDSKKGILVIAVIIGVLLSLGIYLIRKRAKQ